MKQCSICGGEMYPETDGDGHAHDDADWCVPILLANEEQLKKDLATALTRAESAEAQRDDLRALVQGENGLNSRALKIMQLRMEVRRLENENDDLRARVAELEAAQAWRPIADDAPAPLERVVLDDPVDGLDVGWRLPEQPNIFLTRRGRSYLADDIRGWFSIPPTADATGE